MRRNSRVESIPKRTLSPLLTTESLPPKTNNSLDVPGKRANSATKGKKSSYVAPVKSSTASANVNKNSASHSEHSASSYSPHHPQHTGQKLISAEHQHEFTDLNTAVLRSKEWILRTEFEIHDILWKRKVASQGENYFPDTGLRPANILGQGRRGTGSSNSLNEILLGPNDLHDDIISRARSTHIHNQKKLQDSMLKMQEEQAQENERVRFKIQAARNRLIENSVTHRECPKYIHHFFTLNGNIVFMELIGLQNVILLTSNSFFEHWFSEEGGAWRMVDVRRIGEFYPDIKSVCRLDISPSEQQHILNNRAKYDDTFSKGPEETKAEEQMNEDELPMAEDESSPDELQNEDYDLGDVANGDHQSSAAINYDPNDLNKYFTELINTAQLSVSPERKISLLISFANGNIILLLISFELGQGDALEFFFEVVSTIEPAKRLLFPCKFMTYFAPGSFALLIVRVHSPDGTDFVYELRGYEIPSLFLSFRIPISDLIAEAAEKFVPMDTEKTNLDPTFITSDNISLKVFIALQSLILELKFKEIPEFISPSDHDVSNLPSFLSTRKNVNLVLTGATRLPIQSESGIELRSIDADRLDDQGQEQEEEVNNDIIDSELEEKSENFLSICHLAPFYSSVTFKPYILVGGKNGTVHLLATHEPSKWLDFFSYYFGTKNESINNPSTNIAIPFSKNIHACLGATSNGYVSFLWIERRMVLHEQRLLSHSIIATNASADGKQSTTPEKLNKEQYIREIFIGDEGAGIIALTNGSEWSLLSVSQMLRWAENWNAAKEYTFIAL